MSVEITGIDNMTQSELNYELQNGAKFVIYQYCISILVMTFKRPSKIHFIKSNKSPFGKGFKYTLLSFFFGWWGIPWGPIYTIGSIFKNSTGGIDVTQEIKASLTRAPSPDTETDFEKE